MANILLGATGSVAAIKVPELFARLTQAGHQVGFYTIVKDEPDDIRKLMDHLATTQIVQAVLLNGGTGISRRDTTYEAVSGLLEKKLDGFGELFRMLSYQEIGAAAMLSRAIGGIARGKVVFSLPGSTNAVKLGMQKLILPQAGHLYFELQKHAGR